MLRYDRHLKESARRLRKNLTDSERVLWSRLRHKQLEEIQFYRQKPIGSYIVDFFAPSAGLVIEVDGSQHLEGENLRRDGQRDEYLASLGLRVCRFDSRQVLADTEAVLQVIYRAVKERLNSEIPLNPPFSKGDFTTPEGLSVSSS
jgi:very-short-patch-repair endonuclease